MPRHSIIFLPGFMCDGRLFQAQKVALSQSGHRCLDGDITRSASIEGIANDVLVDAPERFALVGLSMGGVVSLEMYRQAPRRVTHLALLNTTAHADRMQAQRKEQLCKVAEGKLGLVMQEELKPNYLAQENRTKDRLQLLSDMGMKLGEEVFARQSIALMNRCSAHDILPTISCPTVVMTGRDDMVCTPEIHIELAEAIPDASLSIIANCGHLSPIEQPQAVTNTLLELLRQPDQLAPQKEGRSTGLSLVKG